MGRRSFGSKFLLVALGAALASALAPPVLYLVGLAFAPELPAPPPEAEPLPPAIAAALWQRLGGVEPVRLEPLTTGRLVRFEWCMARAGLRGGGFDACRARDLDLALAGFVASQHLGVEDGAAETDLRTALGHAAITTWITRNWTASQLLRRHADSRGIDLGPGTGSSTRNGTAP